jgi:hypothetical protein
MRKQYWLSFIAAALVAGCAHTGKINNYRSTQHLNQTLISSPYIENSNPQQDRRSHAIASLKPDSQIQLYTENLGRIEGRFLMSRGDTLFLLTTQRQMNIPIESVDELRVRGSAAKVGAIAGGIVAGLGGLYSGLTIAGLCGIGDPYGESDDSCLSAIPIFTLGGAAVGGLLGAAVGSAVPKWHLLYSSSDG